MNFCHVRIIATAVNSTNIAIVSNPKRLITIKDNNIGVIKITDKVETNFLPCHPICKPKA